MLTLTTPGLETLPRKQSPSSQDRWNSSPSTWSPISDSSVCRHLSRKVIHEFLCPKTSPNSFYLTRSRHTIERAHSLQEGQRPDTRGGTITGMPIHSLQKCSTLKLTISKTTTETPVHPHGRIQSDDRSSLGEGRRVRGPGRRSSAQGEQQ